MLNASIEPKEVLTGVLQKDYIKGEGGTGDYNQLENKPKINGVTLQGNKTTEELGIVSKESDPTVPAHVKAITEKEIEDWNKAVENQDDFLKKNTTIEGNRVYTSQSASDGSITQGTMPFNSLAVAHTIATRESGGALNVGTPTKETHATTKDYVDKSINNVIEVAEGKTKSFTIATLADLGTLLGIDTSVVSDEYTITSTTITYKDKEIELKQGDLLLIVDTNVPDYWVSVDNMKIYKMETTKVDLTDYLEKKTGEFPDGAVRGYVYFIDTQNNQIIKQVQIQATADTIPLRNPNGNFYVKDPTLDYECTNKKYVDGIKTGLQGSIDSVNAGFNIVDGRLNTLQGELNTVEGKIPTITATQLEDGSYSLTIDVEV